MNGTVSTRKHLDESSYYLPIYLPPTLYVHLLPLDLRHMLHKMLLDDATTCRMRICQAIGKTKGKIDTLREEIAIMTERINASHLGRFLFFADSALIGALPESPMACTKLQEMKQEAKEMQEHVEQMQEGVTYFSSVIHLLSNTQAPFTRQVFRL